MSALVFMRLVHCQYFALFGNISEFIRGFGKKVQKIFESASCLEFKTVVSSQIFTEPTIVGVCNNNHLFSVKGTFTPIFLPKNAFKPCMRQKKRAQILFMTKKS